MPSGLSGCAAEYCASLANPFDTGPIGCIPDFPVLQTRKVKFFAKGNFQTGTTGLGFITVTPEYGVVNDQAFAFITNAAFAGNTIDYSLANVTTVNSNSDYASAAFGAAAVLAEYRVVSCGLRVRYAGTELNRGGDMTGFHEPNHQTVFQQNIFGLSAYLEAVRVPVTRNWTNVLYKPVLQTDTFYKNAFPAYTGANTDFNNYMVVAVVAPAAGTSINFDFEVFVNVEFNGRNVQGKTPSYYDPVGFAKVQNWALTALRPSQGPAGGVVPLNPSMVN